MTTYRKRAGAEDASGEGKKLGPPMPCSLCDAITPHETLRTLGARCVPCFRRYCETVPAGPDGGDKRGGHRGWAWALKYREQMGDRLTGPQKQAWREVLKETT